MRTFAAAVELEHGGMPGSVTAREEKAFPPPARVMVAGCPVAWRWAEDPIWLPLASRNDTPG